MAEGLVTHIERSSIDLDLAQRQWDDYVAALHDEGWETIEVPPADDCPDAVFLIELGFIDTDHGPVIVHAMAARRKYLR